MISSTDIKVQYEPVTPTTSYPFNITYFEESDIHVIYTVGDVNTELTLNAISDGFTVSPVNGDPEYGATITTTESYTTDDTITVYREVPVTNETGFVRGGNIPPEVINEINDRGTAVDQQIKAEVSLAFKAPVTDPDGLDYTVGNVSERKNKALGFDDVGGLTSLNLSDSGSIAVDTSTGLDLTNNIISCTVDDSTIEFNGYGQFEVKTITDAEIIDTTISGSKLVDNTISGSKLVDNAITTDKIINGAVTFAKLTGVKDENNMSSNSDTSLATQQSIKAYVDNSTPPNATTSTYGIVKLTNDTTMAGDSSVDVTTEHAVKTYVDNQIAPVYGIQSLTTTGYQVFGSGLIIQWGRFTAAASSGTIVFPNEFMTEIYIVMVTDEAETAGGTSIVGCIYGTPSITGFPWSAQSGNEVCWIAIGK